MRAHLYVLGLVLSIFLSAGPVEAACSSYPWALANGTTADASKVMDNFNCAALTSNATIYGALNLTNPSGNAIYTVHGSNGGIIIVDRGIASSASEILFSTSGTNEWGVGTNQGGAAADAFSFFSYGVGNALTITKSNGFVGILTTTPTYTLQVNGSVAGTSAYINTSDRRLKYDIRPMDIDALRAIERLKPVQFRWRKVTDDGMRGLQLGFVAQDVEKVIPTVVSTQNDENKTKGLKYNEIIALLTKAMQEQQAQIQALKADNQDLRSKYSRLAIEFRSLEARPSIQSASLK